MRLEEGDVFVGRVGREGVDGAGAVVGDDDEIAGFVEYELSGGEWAVADDGELAGLGCPAIDALPVGIDEVELAVFVYGCAGDVVKAFVEFFDFGSGGENCGGVMRLRGDGRVVDGEGGEFAVAD